MITTIAIISGILITVAIFSFVLGANLGDNTERYRNIEETLLIMRDEINALQVKTMFQDRIIKELKGEPTDGSEV